MGATAYLSARCPNCDRMSKTLRRLDVKDVKIVYVDGKQIPGLTAVPTIVDGNNVPHVGTKAFEWLQTYEASVPLEAYATVLGQGTGGLTYSMFDTDETIATTPFSDF